MNTKSFVCANKINLPSEPFTTSFLLPLNSQDLRKMVVFCELWNSCGFLGETARVSTVQILTEFKSELLSLGIMSIISTGGDLEYVTIHTSQVLTDLMSLGYVTLYK